MVDLLKTETAGDPRADVLVTGLNGAATVTVRSWAPDASELEGVAERAAPARCAPPARTEPAVSTPPGNGRARGGARPYVPNRRRQRRTARRARRRRKLAVLLVVLLGLLAVLGTVGFGSARSIQADCDLQDLRPASIGSNSFIYAADGSLARLDPRREEPPAGDA